MIGLWEKTNFKAPINSVIDHTIIEYDMKSANTSIAREFHLLPEERIKEIENMPKEKREVVIGLLKRDDKEYAEAEKQGFIAARKMFMEQNELDESDIIAIKRDAFFVLRYVEHEKVSSNINFRLKNVYSSFLSLKSHSNTIDIFYNRERNDVKGIDDDVYNTYHAEYIGNFIHEVIRRVEEGDRLEVNEYIMNFWDRYKWRELDSGYYREFNPRSDFHYLDGLYANEEYRQNLAELDISHNVEVITSLLQLVI